MSMGVFQPVGQKRLTNIAVVRYKKYGKRFEIACYKNKVKDWRNEIEKDMDEVLQTVEVFSNVSKALLANDEDLKLVFGTTDRAKVCREILISGEMQVSDKERKQEMDVIFKDVAKVLSNMCIDTNTNRPYTHNTLERALQEIHFKVDTKRPAKLQALEALKQLQHQFSIARASLGLLVIFDERAEKETRNTLQYYEAETITEYPQGNKIVIQCTIQPGKYRQMYNQLQQIGNVKVEIDPTATKNEAAVGMGDLSSSTSSQQYGYQQESSLDQTFKSSKAQIQMDSSSNSQNVRQQVREAAASSGQIIYPRGPIAQISDEISNRKQMFLELDSIEEGWLVELIQNGDKIEAVFYSPTGEKAGAFVKARKQALTNRKNSQNS